jgi:RimJ/RimL family protein N-acetyltransferase
MLMMLYGDKICTPRLCLRRVSEEDIPLLVAWSNSAGAHGEFLSPEGTSEEGMRVRLTSGVLWTERSKTFLIEQRRGQAIGTVQYWLRPERGECAVMAVKVSLPELRNQGYGTEAQKYLIINLFQRMKLAEVEMYTDINNKAQQRCLEKLGFQLVQSLGYDDHQVHRLGHLYRLGNEQYQLHPVYQYVYE